MTERIRRSMAVRTEKKPWRRLQFQWWLFVEKRMKMTSKLDEG
jgi:hypothetical protein